ncbi:translocation/assembly module TamB domain-containing protein [Marivivens marinus]|uniref:translocation/assembly module TamB domain-containing protein n=1 Tax=Marivivens marinus TaxID=3110173 RepID=UPI003B8485FA
MRRAVLAFCLVATPALSQDAAEDDKGYITTFLEENLSGAGRVITIDGFEGALSAQATIDSLTVADDVGVWLRMEDLTLDWSRSALLSGRVDITELSAGLIAVDRLPNTVPDGPAPEATPFALPDLPVSIDIGTLAATRIELGAPLLGEQVAVGLTGTVSLDGGAGSATVRAARLDDGRVGEFDITAAYSNDTRQLDLSLILNEGPGGIAARLLDLPGLPSVGLEIVGGGPLEDFGADLRLATDDTPRLTGRFDMVTGAEDGAQTIDLAASGDVTALFLPEYRDFFGPQVRLNTRVIRFADGATELDQLDLSARTLGVSGTARIGADGWPERFSLVGQLTEPDGAPLRLPIAGDPTTVAGGTLMLGFDAARGNQWRVHADLKGLVRPDLSIAQIIVTGGGMIDPGRADAPGAFTADVDYAAQDVALADEGIQQALGDGLSGVLSLRHVEGEPTYIDQLILDGPGIALSARAEIAGADQDFAIDSSVNLAARDMGRFASLLGQDIGGAADVTIVSRLIPTSGAVRAQVAGETVDLRVGIAQVDPLLTGAGQLSVMAVRDHTGTRLDGLSIATPRAEISGDLSLTSAAANADIRMALVDIADIDPRLSGPAVLTATGQRASSGLGRIEAEVQSGADRIALLADLPETDTGAPIRANLAATVTNLSRFAEISGQTLSGAVSSSVTGTLAEDLSTFDLAVAAQSQSLQTGNTAVDPLLRGAGRVSARIARSEDGRIDLPEIEIVTPAANLSAALSTSAEGAGTGRFDARLADVGLLAPDFSGPASATGTAQRGADGIWSINANGSGPGGTTMALRGTATEDPVLNLSATGSAPLGLLNGMLAPRRLGGIARYDLRLSGRPDLSALSGTITTESAQLSAPTLGQSIDQISTTVTLSNGSARIDMTAAPESGGQLALRGSVGMTAPFNAALTVEAADFVQRDRQLYDTTISGALGINGPLAGGARIDGRLSLGETNLRVPSSDFGTLGALPEVAHIGAPAPVRQTLDRAGLTLQGTEPSTGGSGGPAYPLDIVVDAPARVFVRGRGLDAELGGSLRLTGTTALVIPQGQFNLIRGRLSILQQRFDLTEGFAAIQGDFVPYVRLLASTRAATGTMINVIIEGVVTEPEVSFTSSPELPQDEILAQLIFGRDLSEISPFQAVQLAGAISTLAGRGGAGFVDNLRAGIGLDDLDVTTDADGNAAVRAGKYISENVYTDVTVTGTGETRIDLNLDVTSDITAKGGVSSDGETSLGIFFERDY